MKILQSLLPERPWVWAVSIYAVNFAILWMTSFVAACNEGGGPGVCEATRPLSQIGILSMIGLAVSFPSMLVSVAAVRLGLAALAALYFGVIVFLAMVTLVFYREGYFAPLEARCIACDRVFLTQVSINMLWVFVVFPGKFLVPYLWKQHRAKRM